MVNIGVPELVLILLCVAAGIAATVFWIWMLVECIMKEPEGNERIAWAVVITITHLVGAVVYFLVRRPKRMQAAGV